MERITFGVLTISDSCFKGTAVDSSGTNLVSMIQNGIVDGGEIVKIGLVPDDKSLIQQKLKEWCDLDKVNVVLTTGGTGIAETDVTPEATSSLLDKEIPGIPRLILNYSSQFTPLSALSRGVAGVRKKTLIVNLPGSKKASKECFECISNVLPHAVNLICNNERNIKMVHSALRSRKSKVGISRGADRPRKSMYPCIEVLEAQKIVTERVGLLKKETDLNFQDALGFVLAQDVVARDNLPPFDASLKDGYAVLSSDQMKERIVDGVAAAGDSNTPCLLVSGHCIRINTGAAIPEGADAVVQIEDTTLISRSPTGSHETEISLENLPQKGQDVRLKGSDFKVGDLLIESETLLESAALGLLAAAGVTSIKVFAKPIVGVFSTGDELVEPNEPLTKGKIRDSNKIALLGLLKEKGFSGLDLGIVKDNPDSLLEALETGFRSADVLVTTGSMSMGEKDYMKDVLTLDFGAEICFGRIFMKPGKPTAFAVLEFEGKRKLWFGLPGNPASAIVTAHLFLLPALKTISGFKSVFPPVYPVTLNEDITLDDRPHYIRASLLFDSSGSNWVVSTTGNQRSSRIASCLNAKALLRIPPIEGCSSEKIKKGEKVEALLLDHF